MKDGEASSTALTVAQGILYTASKEEFAGLVTPAEIEACRAILSCSPEGRKRLKELESPIVRFFTPLKERLLLPGITLHYVLRKKFIEEQTRRAIKNGCKQIVNLGAGMDSLLYRLSQEFPDIKFFELDHPATSSLKQQFFDSVNFANQNFFLLPADFTKTTAEKELAPHAAFDKDTKTFFILEGVIMYLNESQVRELFAALNRLVGGRTAIVFTYLDADPKGKHALGPLLKLYLKIKSESILWRIGPADLPDFVKSIGYKLIDRADAPALRKRYLPGRENAVSQESELMALVEPE